MIIIAVERLTMISTRKKHVGREAHYFFVRKKFVFFFTLNSLTLNLICEIYVTNWMVYFFSGQEWEET